MLLLTIILVFSFFTIYYYMAYGNSIENKEDAVSVAEKRDFETLKSKDASTLEQLGFSEKEINTIQEVDLEQLTFNNFISLLEFNDNKTVNPEDLVPVEIKQHQERTEGAVVNIHVKPVEAVYLNEEGGISMTFYTKLHYTVDIKKPMIFQSADEFKLNFNNWYSMFEYAKLHYISPSGEVFEDYVTRKKTSNGDVSFKFEIKQKRDGDIYYLSGISGISIMKSPNDLSLYGEYSHNQFYKNSVLGKHWSDWQWSFE